MSAANLRSTGGPLATIAIPTFNRAPLLKDCIDSALAQTFDRFEVVVSDNASTDDTQNVLAGFDDSRLRIVRQDTNIGLIPNWNACLAAARGDYVVILPDDDRLAPHFLARCFELIERQPGLPIVLTLCNVRAVALGRTRRARASRRRTTGVWNGTEILTDFLTDQITVTMCGILMRTGLVRSAGGIPAEYPHTGDFAAWAPLLFAGKAGLVNEPCATFAFHNETETERLSVEQRVHDGSRMVTLISRLADEHVADPQTRQSIKCAARRCFARRGLATLSDYRKNGGGLQKLWDLVWNFRRDLQGADLGAAMRFAATVFCPQVVADWIRRLRPTA